MFTGIGRSRWSEFEEYKRRQGPTPGNSQSVPFLAFQLGARCSPLAIVKGLTDIAMDATLELIFAKNSHSKRVELFDLFEVTSIKAIHLPQSTPSVWNLWTAGGTLDLTTQKTLNDFLTLKVYESTLLPVLDGLKFLLDKLEIVDSFPRVRRAAAGGNGRGGAGREGSGGAGRSETGAAGFAPRNAAVLLEPFLEPEEDRFADHPVLGRSFEVLSDLEDDW